MLTTTLNRIRAHEPCVQGWSKLLAYLGKTKADDEPLPYAIIVQSNGLDDALWCCRAAPHYEMEWWLFIRWCINRISPLMIDPNVAHALDVTGQYVSGVATREEIIAAWNVAQWVALDTASFIERSTGQCDVWSVAREASYAVTEGAAWNIAWSTTRVASWLATCARYDDPWKDAWDAERAAQTQEFLRIVTQ